MWSPSVPVLHRLKTDKGANCTMFPACTAKCPVKKMTAPNLKRYNPSEVSLSSKSIQDLMKFLTTLYNNSHAYHPGKCGYSMARCTSLHWFQFPLLISLKPTIPLKLIATNINTVQIQALCRVTLSVITKPHSLVFFTYSSLPPPSPLKSRYTV